MWTSTQYNNLSNYDFVLGSSSPRRQDILQHNIGISKFRVIKPTFDEDLPKDGSDIQYVTKTAEFKALSILPQIVKPSLVLVADTVVSCGGQIYEKPETDQIHLQMLESYRQNPVKVITAVHVFRVVDGKVQKHVFACETTELVFDSTLGTDALHQYIGTGEGRDAAGGFKYQGLGSMLFGGVRGDYFNVVGLPVKMTKSMVVDAMGGSQSEGGVRSEEGVKVKRGIT